MKKLLLLIFYVKLSCTVLTAQYSYPFQNPSLTIDQRVKDLISRMTPEEKISQLMNNSPAIDRLGIPQYNWWNECLHGVARAGYATVFPQSITIAASWDRNLIYDVASTISDEARAKHHEYIRRGQRDIYQGLTFWSPNINIFRDPRWGRGHETYGEDPYLTGQLGLQFVEGLQGDNDKYLKLVATAKHFAVHSGPEPLRHEFNANPSFRDLWETYLPAFRTLVEEGHVYSVMGAYNRIYGEAACASTTLFDILRNKWGFKGYVVSDCGAINDIWKNHKIVKDAESAAALALKEGCDLNCGSTYKELKEAYKDSLINDSILNLSLKRLLTARFKLGMFDPEDSVSYAQIPYWINDNPANNDQARKAAQESIILLKNQNHILPLSKDIQSIAVIGPTGDDIQSLLGNYHGTPSHPVTILQGLKNKLSPKVKINYAVGSPFANDVPVMQTVPSVFFETPDGKQGLTGEYYNNPNCEGEPLLTKTDENIDFNWDINTPDPRFKIGQYSIKWTGYLIAPKSGTYYFSDWGKPYMSFSINNGEEYGGNHTHQPSINPQKIDLIEGEKYKIEVKYENYFGDATAKLLWSIPDDNLLEDAIETAKKSDIVILTLGLNERLEGEEMQIQVDGFSQGDRTSLNLPETQKKLMEAIFNTGKPVILILNNGSALSINWATKNIPAIISAGYPGQQGGNAVADVLFGDYNPAGRLPVTYYKSADQLPAFDNYDMKGRTYRYFKQEPLFPFGYGLSYTTFKYSNLTIPKQIDMNQPVSISVDVTNTGNYDGDEVAELYIKDEKASTERPIVQLEEFNRIHLKKGETKTLQFQLLPRQLSMINNKNKLVVEPGWFTIYVGGKQPLLNNTNNNVSLVHSRFKVIGKTTEIDF